MVITPNKVLCIAGNFFSSAEIRYFSNVFIFLSKLSATSLSPNPALAKLFFTVFA
jgi:hypothetical protein